MRRRPQPEGSSSESQSAGDEINVGGDRPPGVRPKAPQTQRSPFVFLALFVAIVYSSWSVYHYQYQNLPSPLTSEQAGKRGFSEYEALNHVKALTELGPHPIGSDALVLALQVGLISLEDFLIWVVFIFQVYMSFCYKVWSLVVKIFVWEVWFEKRCNLELLWSKDYNWIE